MRFRRAVLGQLGLILLLEVPSFWGYLKRGTPFGYWASYLRFTGLPLGLARWGDFVLFLSVLLGLFYFYRMGGSDLVAERVSTRAVVSAALLLSLALVPIFPFLSQDVFGYVGQGRLLDLGYNPLTTAIASLPHWKSDIVFRLAGWQTTVSPYGPLFALLAGGIYRLGGTWWGAVLAWKLLAALLQPLTVLVLARTGGPRAGYLYGLNPLILLEVVGQAHNDLLLVLFLALALLLRRRGLGTPAWLSIFAGVSVKYVPLLWVPFLLRRRGLRTELPGLLAGGLLLFVAFLPFLAGLETLRGILGQGRLLFHSLPALLAGIFHLLGWGRAGAASLAKAAGLLLFLGVYLRLLWRRDLSPERGLLLVLLAFLALGISWFQPWYLSWAAVPAALLPAGDRWGRAFWGITLGAELGRSLLLPLHVNGLAVTAAAYLLTWAPLAGVLGRAER